MRLTLVITSLIIACHGAAASHLHVNRDFLSQFISAASTFIAGDGGTTTKTTSTAPSTTVKGAPVAATATISSNTKTGNTKTSSPTKTATSSSSSASSNTISSSSSTASTLSTITSPTASSTISTSTTLIPVPSNPANTNPSPTPSATPSNNQSGITPAGIAVAVVLSLFILGIIAWLIFRYHPRSRAWWTARQERRFQQRSYRDALDGPNAYGGVREQALGGHGRKSAYLASFFAPRTVRLGGGKEIRRKPVEWGAGGRSDDGEEKVALADMASPMGRSPIEMVGTPNMMNSPIMKGYDKPLPRIEVERVV